MAIPYVFFSISHVFYYVSVNVSPVFLGIPHVVLWTCCKFWPMINIFSKTIIQKEANYVFFFTKLPRIIVSRDFLPSSFTLKKRYATSLGKICILVISGRNSSSELNFFRTVLCKISHICRTGFKKQIHIRYFRKKS